MTQETPKIVRNVKRSPLIIETNTSEPYYEVTMRIYPETTQDLSSIINIEQECLLIGQQLCEVLKQIK